MVQSTNEDQAVWLKYVQQVICVFSVETNPVAKLLTYFLLTMLFADEITDVCGITRFRCSVTNVCIFNRYRCDGVVDCSKDGTDKSDESEQVCKTGKKTFLIVVKNKQTNKCTKKHNNI
jgi:hypothetical protein